MILRSNVLVIGAGIIGCSVGHALAAAGARVRILDRRLPGAGATQASAGMLAPHIEGHERGALLQLAVDSLAMWDEFAARVSKDSGVAVEYARTGTLEIADDEPRWQRLRTSFAEQQRHGVESRLLTGDEARALEPALGASLTGALLVQTHGFVAVHALVRALLRAARRAGAELLSGVEVMRIAREERGVRVETDGASLHADHVILAAGSWAGRIEIEGADPIPVKPVRGQLLELAWPAQRLRRIVWGPSCYVVPWQSGSFLVGATAEDVGFDERATVSGVRALIDGVCRIIPSAAEASLPQVRVGLRPATPDELPVLGRSAAIPGLVYATGHFRNGILLAPLTAHAVAELVLQDRAVPALASTAPSRFGHL